MLADDRRRWSLSGCTHAWAFSPGPACRTRLSPLRAQPASSQGLKTVAFLTRPRFTILLLFAQSLSGVHVCDGDAASVPACHLHQARQSHAVLRRHLRRMRLDRSSNPHPAIVADLIILCATGSTCFNSACLMSAHSEAQRLLSKRETNFV